MKFNDLNQRLNESSVDKLEREVQKLEDKYTKIKKPPVKQMDKKQLQYEIDLLMDYGDALSDLDVKRNPWSPVFVERSKLNREEAIRLNVLSSALYYIEREERGDAKERIKAKLLLRKNKIKVKNWNDITWKEIQDMLIKHNLSL